MSIDWLVIGYGNTLRGDDGIGPSVAGEVAALGLSGVRVMVVHQLTPELAADLADARGAVFVDSKVCVGPTTVERIEAAPTGSVMTHAADPRGLMALCEAIYQRCPESWLVTAPGIDFGFHDGLSPIGRESTREAIACIERVLRESSGA